VTGLRDHVPAAGKRRYCREACRVATHRRRHQPPEQPDTALPDRQPQPSRTVYQCANCDTRALGRQRCNDCGAFMNRLGLGGLCPCCDEPVTIDEITTNQ